jgi:hypothetical protein
LGPGVSGPCRGAWRLSLASAMPGARPVCRCPSGARVWRGVTPRPPPQQ